MLELLAAGPARRPAPRALGMAKLALALGGAAQIAHSRTDLTASP